MKTISLTQGQIALVDSDDFESISKYKWHAIYKNNNFYAARAMSKNARIKQYMHRLITSAPSGMVVNHINHNTLDNRKENLRVCTQDQNAKNRKIHKRQSIRFIGVYKCHKKWGARIGHKGKLLHLGVFDSQEEAAIARDKMALKLRSEFAHLNFEINRKNGAFL